MNSHEYEELLAELRTARAEARRDPERRRRRDEAEAQFRAAEELLLSQQADLLNTARELRLSPPRLRPNERESTEPGQPPGADPARVFAVALRGVESHVAASDSAAERAWRLAQLPAFLPQQRPRIRHAAVYGLCAAVAALAQVGVLASAPTSEVFWTVAAVPLLAWIVGVAIVGRFDRPRLRPTGKRRRGPARDAKLGLAICLVLGAAVLVWGAA